MARDHQTKGLSSDRRIGRQGNVANPAIHAMWSKRRARHAARCLEIFRMAPGTRRCWRGTTISLIDVFSRMRADLAAARNVQIVSDAVDGYNPIHDLAYAFGQALSRGLGKTTKVSKQLCSAAVPNVAGPVELEIQLPPAARARKMAAVETYSPLADEARRILERDPHCFDRENLISQDFDWNSSWTPEWELIGKQRVADGRYRNCITYRDNVQPAAQRLISESAAVFAAVD